MSKHNTPCHGSEQPKNGSPFIGDCVNYKSRDGLVEVITKVTTAKRHPQHDYPIVCIRVRPKKGTRIQTLPGSGGVEILFSHIEVIRHLQALNQADRKSRYTWLEIPEKPTERKAFWNKKNQERWENRNK